MKNYLTFYIIFLGDNMDRLKEIRNDRDLLQKDVARILHIKQQQYSEYERGKRQIPIFYLCKLADFYHVSIDYILYRTDVRIPYPRSIMRQ